MHLMYPSCIHAATRWLAVPADRNDKACIVTLQFQNSSQKVVPFEPHVSLGVSSWRTCLRQDVRWWLFHQAIRADQGLCEGHWALLPHICIDAGPNHSRQTACSAVSNLHLQPDLVQRIMYSRFRADFCNEQSGQLDKVPACSTDDLN